MSITSTGYPTDWKRGVLAGCIAQSSYGEIWTVRMREGDREHTRPVFIDRGGTICVVVDRQGNVVIQTILRPTCKKGDRINLPIIDPSRIFGEFGTFELEFPRGASSDSEDAIEVGFREVQEEIGLESRYIVAKHYLGEFFSNGYCPQPIDAVLYVVRKKLPLEISPKAQLGELIRKAEWKTEEELWKMIANGQIRDQQTLAAWSMYQAMKKSNQKWLEQ